MSEMRLQEVSLIGRMKSDPISTDSKECYFKIDAGGNLPFPCFCNGKTAENATKFLKDGDEVAIEGKLHMKQFRGEKQPILLVFARHISYGRKTHSLVSNY